MIDWDSWVGEMEEFCLARGMHIAGFGVVSLSISGSECVAALQLAGFVVMQHCGGVTFLGHRDRIVVVPDAIILHDDTLAALLAEADLSHNRFLWLLSEATTAPDLLTLAPLDETA